MISTLIIKYLNGDATELETRQVYNWIEESEENKKHFTDLKKTWALSQNADAGKREIWNNIKKLITTKKTNHFKEYLKYVAILIISAIVGTLIWFNKTSSNVNTNGIVLEIQDTNTKIDLNKNVVNDLKQLQGVILSQNDNEIVYNEIITNQPISYHSLNIPYGKIFKATLADGTIVHLNAGSSLRYPQQFKSNGARKVFLDGEAYFDVRKDENRPFIVITDEVSVEVLGTEFNVNTSDYLKEFHCVLVEGTVKLSDTNNNVILSPGQKGTKTLSSDSIKVNEVNIETYVSWIYGDLLFEDAAFDQIANKLSKFYNIKIDNRNEALKNQIFSGSISLQNSNLESILELLSLDTPFSYQKAGDTIIIND